jgi:hypothetical protein
MSCNSRPCLPAKVGSSAITCPMTSDPTWLLGGLWCCHRSYGTRPHLPTEVSSGATTCPTAPNPTFLPRWAPALPCIPWHRTPPPCWGGLWSYHMSYGSGPHLPTEVGSNPIACPMALDLASRPGRVPVLPCVPQFPMRHGPQIYKERLSWPTYAAKLVCFQGTHACSHGA